jgi:hypothetical protein
MKSMRKIITDMDNIIYIDLMAIKLIADTTLGNRAPLVGQAIQLVVNLYNRLVPIRDNLVNKI